MRTTEEAVIMAEEAVKTDTAEPRKLSKRALKQERMKDLSTGERRYLLRLALQKRIWKVFRFVRTGLRHHVSPYIYDKLCIP